MSKTIWIRIEKKQWSREYDYKELPAETPCKQRYLLWRDGSYGGIAGLPIVTLKDIPEGDIGCTISVLLNEEWIICESMRAPIEVEMTIKVRYFDKEFGGLHPVRHQLNQRLKGLQGYFNEYILDAKIIE